MERKTIKHFYFHSKQDPKKLIQFRDIAENVDVQHYIRLQTKTKHKLPRVSALCSSENEVCLFPADVPHGLCKYVAGLYRAYQEVVISRLSWSTQRDIDYYAKLWIQVLDIKEIIGYCYHFHGFFFSTFPAHVSFIDMLLFLILWS